MNDGIATYLNENYLKDLPWVERIAGVVRPLVQVDVVDLFNEDNVKVGEQVVRKVYPVACDITHADCLENERYYDLVPNSERRSIMYFEDKGTVWTGTEGRLQYFTGSLRLVGWLNLEMFETNSCTISAAVIASIIKTIPRGNLNFTGTPYQRVNILPTNIAPKNQQIFAHYSYSEETNQYLMYPYDYFALDLSVHFAIHENCIDEIVVKEQECAQL